jgi:hypothetical protein
MRLSAAGHEALEFGVGSQNIVSESCSIQSRLPRPLASTRSTIDMADSNLRSGSE